MDGSSEPRREGAGSGAASTREALRAQALGKRVQLPTGPLTILEDVSFSIKAGETVAIVGASGSGKSTLLSLLAGLDTPSSGEVELAGEPLSKLDEDGRAAVRGRHVGFVFQSFQLLPSLTALENVMLPLELSGAKDAETQAREILRQVGLSERLSHYPRQLSGGEQQRVALARAFVTRPAVLFADEPTGNLDTKTGESVVELLFEMNASSGTTLVLVTHDPKLAARCGRVLRIDAGRLLA
ncbi:ABC transporter ATP-binding protein [Aquimonas voraii]|uniref:Putative ABC transport system ATP-binding protein n=1 Tax=Aquimonas voraii TaxID=265719 RepID=A0A1G6RZC9_9GAMM|nr:ABC transporter ATP-binding protein [Aquimonas voraii]SDD09959.1 putative ABC transport system ATP-binding protein [Aquimonas voraii]